MLDTLEKKKGGHIKLVQMHVTVIQSPNTLQNTRVPQNLTREIAHETSSNLDSMALAHHGLWSYEVNSLLTEHYNRATMLYKKPSLLFTEHDISTDRWHISRRAELGDTAEAAIGFEVRYGIAIMFVRHCSIHMAGMEARDCIVHHLWRTRHDEIDLVQLDRLGQDMLPPDTHVTMRQPSETTHQIDIGGDWAFILYNGPIRPHPEETFALKLAPGGVVFAMALAGDHLTPMRDLGNGEDAVQAFPSAFDQSLPITPHTMTYFRRRDVGCWAIRLRLNHRELSNPDDLEDFRPVVRQTDGRRIEGQRGLGRWLEILRKLQPQSGPEATYSPQRFSQPLPFASGRGLPAPLNRIKNFDQSASFFSSTTTDMMSHAPRLSDLRFTTASNVMTATYGPHLRPVYFLPFKHKPQILLFVDSSTFFYLEQRPDLRPIHPEGLPTGFSVGMIGLERPADCAQLIERAIGQATDVYSMLMAISNVFKTHPPTDTPTSMFLVTKSNDGDPMDLVDQSD